MYIQECSGVLPVANLQLTSASQVDHEQNEPTPDLATALLLYDMQGIHVCWCSKHSKRVTGQSLAGQGLRTPCYAAAEHQLLLASPTLLIIHHTDLGGTNGSCDDSYTSLTVIVCSSIMICSSDRIGRHLASWSLWWRIKVQVTFMYAYMLQRQFSLGTGHEMT